MSLDSRGKRKINIWITTDNCLFETEISRLVRLFYEDCQFLITDNGDASPTEMYDVHIHLSVTESNHLLSATGSLMMTEHTFTASHTKDLAGATDGTFIRKRTKQAVLHVLHQLLERVTGVHQPWGILTGVRPMKLMHTYLSQGLSLMATQEKLEHEYLIRPDRISLMSDIVATQLQVVPDLYQLEQEVSVYIGIPFCPTHCAYCTFPAYSMEDKATYAFDFLTAMEREIQQLGRLLREYAIGVTTVYIGGGTPTSLRAGEMERMMMAIYKDIPGAGEWREFSVEAGRPDTITPDRVAVMKKFGVNRISVNPQTFNANTLRAIGRGHSPEIVDHRFGYVRDAGFDNINMDVILGLPGETLDDVLYTLDRVGQLNPDSFTVHTMSLKRGADVKTNPNRYIVSENEIVSQMMSATRAWTDKQGYHPYYVYRQKDILANLENIGYARVGKDSVYNISIMEERQTIVGIGGGAATKLIGPHAKHMGRFANPREPKAYVEGIEALLHKKETILRRTFEALTNHR